MSGPDVQREEGPADTVVYPGGHPEGGAAQAEAGKTGRKEGQADREGQGQGREKGFTGWAGEVSRLPGPSGGRRAEASFSKHLLSPSVCWMPAEILLDALKQKPQLFWSLVQFVICRGHRERLQVPSGHQGTPDGGRGDT